MIISRAELDPAHHKHSECSGLPAGFDWRHGCQALITSQDNHYQEVVIGFRGDAPVTTGLLGPGCTFRYTLELPDLDLSPVNRQLIGWSLAFQMARYFIERWKAGTLLPCEQALVTAFTNQYDPYRDQEDKNGFMFRGQVAAEVCVLALGQVRLIGETPLWVEEIKAARATVDPDLIAIDPPTWQKVDKMIASLVPVPPLAQAEEERSNRLGILCTILTALLFEDQLRDAAEDRCNDDSSTEE